MLPGPASVGTPAHGPGGPSVQHPYTDLVMFWFQCSFSQFPLILLYYRVTGRVFFSSFFFFLGAKPESRLGVQLKALLK